VTRFAHAFRRVRRRAFAVDAAGEPLARTFAFVGVFRVAEVGRRAGALTRLDAVFIGAAVLVADAAHLRRRADAFVRIARVVGRTEALERSR